MAVIYSPTPPHVLKRQMSWVTSRAQMAAAGGVEWAKILEKKRQELHVPAIAAWTVTMHVYDDEVIYYWMWEILVFEEGMSL
ncbi:hypothetical protein QEH42_gp230 [Microbacterium phage Pumpernickel]|uniref:Uncharacterized protein n=1 Tax=Microbacterium phage Pumpernickel TaxID=2885983 RepID=A0AAE8Y8H2_9CAUD|nr:hypothetical protein QEH42_gp230 [Microbacterium phage Pumpernickel]UDL15988.1 hypothetical protein SEA_PUMPERNICKEL_238 [Microbacterium phage Pumpernickel]